MNESARGSVTDLRARIAAIEATKPPAPAHVRYLYSPIFERRTRAEAIYAPLAASHNAAMAAWWTGPGSELLGLRRALATAERSAAAQARALRPEHQRRQLIFRHLRRLGFSREYVSGASAYYSNGGLNVRVSDHEVPASPEREYNRTSGGFTWCDSWRSFVISATTTPCDCLRWLVGVRQFLQIREAQ